MQRIALVTGGAGRVEQLISAALKTAGYTVVANPSAHKVATRLSGQLGSDSLGSRSYAAKPGIYSDSIATEHQSGSEFPNESESDGVSRLTIDFLDVPIKKATLDVKIMQLVLEKSEHCLQFPLFEELARHFCMSPKTLQRKLRREGLTYQKIKHSIRRDFVVEQLRNLELSITQVAHMAGLAEVSSLNKMFVKWTGMSPSLYRKQFIS